MNNVYQEIILIYQGNAMEGLNHSKSVHVNLTNDYSLEDIFDAFTEFLQCIGFSLTRTEVIEKLRDYVEENL